jgi:YVTN family beta-propeller protein
MCWNLRRLSVGSVRNAAPRVVRGAFIGLALLCVTAACDRGDYTPEKNAASSTPVNMPTATGTAANGGSSQVATGTAGTVAIAVPIAGRAGAAGSNNAGGGAPLIDEDAGTEPSADASTNPSGDHLDCTPNAYVANSGSNSVSAIDTTTNKVVATIPTGAAPVNPTFTPDHRQVYVSNSQANTITVIDVATNKATTIPAGGDRPSGLAFLPDGKKLVVTLLGETIATTGFATIITLASGEVAPLIPVGAQCERISLSPSGDRAYISNLGDGTMSVVDVAAGKVITTITLGDLPFNSLMTPDGKLLYVGVLLSNKIAVVDPLTNMVVRSIDSDSPNGMTFSPDYTRLYVSNAFGGTVQEISLETSMVTKTGMFGGLPGYIALLPDGKHAYVVRPDGNTVEVVDTTTLMIVNTITVESGPSTTAVCRGK